MSDVKDEVKKAEDAVKSEVAEDTAAVKAAVSEAKTAVAADAVVVKSNFAKYAPYIGVALGILAILAIKHFS